MSAGPNLSPLRIGTRGSQLALWQANHIADRLRPVVAPRPVELVLIETHGDADQVRPLAEMGGFGVFTRSIQLALIDGRCDVAVHSLKDLPTIPVPELALAASPQRGPTGDVFISHKWEKFDDVPAGSTIATSSLRRRAQILNRRPDLNLVNIRGNVETRIRKLREQDLDGLILAEAGVTRLGLGEHITEVLDAEWMLPAVGQGAIGLECRADDRETIHFVEAVTDPATWTAVRAERAMLSALGGGCLVPIGVTAEIADHALTLRGCVLSPDGKRRIVDTHRGSSDQPSGVGQELAATMLAAGAGELLEA